MRTSLRHHDALSIGVTGSITAAQAASYASQTSKLGAAVRMPDSASAVTTNLANLATLAGASLLGTITYTDAGTPSLSLTAAAFAGGGSALAHSSSTYSVTISTGTLTVAQLQTASTLGLLSSVSGTINLSDSGANVISGLSSLLTNVAKIGTITLTDSGTPLW